MFVVPGIVPIFIPFGYANIGKTVMIQRLIRYLYHQGFIVQPELVFNPSPDYQHTCERYMWEAQHSLPQATAVNDTILLRVLNRNGMAVCYILDIAGECQYDMYHPHVVMSVEMNAIIHTPNKKIWGFMVDNGVQLDSNQQQQYVNLIRNYAINVLEPKDKEIFIYSKVDQTQWGYGNVNVSWRVLFDTIDSQYPNIFEPFEETNAFKRLIKGKYRFILQPFHSICILENGNNVAFMDGNDHYPQLLWNNLLELIREK